MEKITFRTVLVVGDNPDELIKKYDLDTKVNPYVKMRRSDAGKARETHLKFVEAILTSDKINLTWGQREAYKNVYLDLKDMDGLMYFEHSTIGCSFDKKTGDALSTVNPEARYQHAVNPQKRLDLTNEEHDFANPFILLPIEGEDGESISYTALKSEIDWTKMHMANAKVYDRAWDLCVNGDEPQNEEEKKIKAAMENREQYFKNFANKEEYVNYSCAFWCYGYLDKDGYKELDYSTSDKDWVENFYNRFVKTADSGTLMSIYIVRAI